MSAETLTLALPERLVLEHQDPTAAQAYAQDQAALKKLRGVMVLDKLNQEAIIKRVQPELELVKETIDELSEQLVKLGKREVGDLNLSTEFAAVKKAMRDLKINSLTFSIDFCGLDLVKKGKIRFRRTIGEKSSPYSRSMSGDDAMPFTPEMSALLTQLNEAQAKQKVLLEQITDAQSKLRDRANRMSDAEGAFALRTMSSDELAEVKDIYGRLESGMTVTALLGE